MSRIRPIIASIAVLSFPLQAASPPFETSAPIAYMVDLSSGAVLYQKDADRRVPPASMTTGKHFPLPPDAIPTST